MMGQLGLVILEYPEIDGNVAWKIEAWRKVDPVKWVDNEELAKELLDNPELPEFVPEEIEEELLTE